MKPGLYGVGSGADTLLDMISQAGGIAPGSDSRIYFIPAEQTDGAEAQNVAASLPQTLLRRDPAPLILKRTDPAIILLFSISVQIDINPAHS